MTAATERRDALVQRLFDATLGTWDVLAVYLGSRLGLYRALGEGDATTSELAERAGTNERYVREWLEQQASSGILDVDEPAAEAGKRRYSLPAGHDEALLDEMSLNFIAPIAKLVAACVQSLMRPRSRAKATTSCTSTRLCTTCPTPSRCSAPAAGCLWTAGLS